MLTAFVLAYSLMTTNPICDVVTQFHKDVQKTADIYQFVDKAIKEGDVSGNLGNLIRIHKELEKMEEDYEKLIEKTTDPKEKRMVKKMEHFFYASERIAYYGVKYITTGNHDYIDAFKKKANEAQDDIDEVNKEAKKFNCPEESN